VFTDLQGKALALETTSVLAAATADLQSGIRMRLEET